MAWIIEALLFYESDRRHHHNSTTTQLMRSQQQQQQLSLSPLTFGSGSSSTEGGPALTGLGTISSSNGLVSVLLLDPRAPGGDAIGAVDVSDGETLVRLTHSPLSFIHSCIHPHTNKRSPRAATSSVSTGSGPTAPCSFSSWAAAPAAPATAPRHHSSSSSSNSTWARSQRTRRAPPRWRAGSSRE